MVLGLGNPLGAAGVRTAKNGRQTDRATGLCKSWGAWSGHLARLGSSRAGRPLA